MNAYIYARQSSGDGEESDSVEVQIENCMNYAKEHNFTVIKVFKDLDLSGRLYPSGAESFAELDIAFQAWWKDTSHRESEKYRFGLGALFAVIQKGDILLVDDYTRLMRPIPASFLESYINQILITRQVVIHTVKTGIVNPAVFQDNLITTIQSQINHQQILIQTKKSKAGQRRVKDSGGLTAGECLMCGYRYLGRQRFEIVEEEAKAIKMIFLLARQNYSYVRICREINKNFPLGKRTLLDSNVRRILKRPEYAGYTHNTRGELIKCLPLQGLEIIDLDLFLEVQEVLKHKPNNASKDKSNFYPFTGIIFCGECGSRLFVMTSRKGKYYSCRHNTIITGTACKSRIRYKTGVKPAPKWTTFAEVETAEKMIEKLRETIKSGEEIPDTIPYFGLYETLMPLATKYLIDKTKEFFVSRKNKNNIAALKVKLDKISELETKISEMFIEGTITDEQMKNMMKGKREEREKIQDEINKFEFSEKTNVDAKLGILNATFADIVSHELPETKYQTAINASLKSIVVYNDYIKVTMNDEKSFKLKRFWTGLRKNLPAWSIKSNYESLTEKTKLTIKYFYPSAYDNDTSENIIYQSKEITIIEVGK